MTNDSEQSEHRPMPRRPPSLVFLIPGFPKDEADTTCLPAVQHFVAAFAEAHPELQMHVLAFQYPFTRGVYGWRNVIVHALGGRNQRRLRRLATWARAGLAFLTIYRQTDVQALHSFWLTECTWVARRLSRLFRLRHIASIGGQDALEDNPYHAYLNLKGTILTAGSAFAAATYTRHSERAVDHVIPLGLDAAHLQQIAAPPERDIDVLGVGSLTSVKNYAAFVDVVAHLVPAFPQVRACLVGDGPLREDLLRGIAERGLQEHVVLAGALPRDEAFRYMLRSKVFLHTARYESQGYVFLEALFAGLPVVCFDVGYTGASDRVVRCAALPAMADAVADLLRTSLRYTQVAVPTTEDTVRAFEPLYALQWSLLNPAPGAT